MSRWYFFWLACFVASYARGDGAWVIFLVLAAMTSDDTYDTIKRRLQTISETLNKILDK